MPGPGPADHRDGSRPSRPTAPRSIPSCPLAIWLVDGKAEPPPYRFFTSGDPLEEVAWRSQWLPADLPAGQRERIVKRQATAPDLVVVQPVKDWTCAECGDTGDLLIMDDKGPLCMTCADMGHLVFLPSGDAALTRRPARWPGPGAHRDRRPGAGGRPA